MIYPAEIRKKPIHLEEIRTGLHLWTGNVNFVGTESREKKILNFYGSRNNWKKLELFPFEDGSSSYKKGLYEKKHRDDLGRSFEMPKNISSEGGGAFFV